MEEKVMELLANITSEAIEDKNMDLLASDILDSFDIVNLVVALEDAFNITIDAEWVLPEKFQTANAIIELIKEIVNSQE